MKLKSPAIGLAIIVLANAFALGGAARNRAGEPESRLDLSGRELRMVNPYTTSENSGVSLRLQWCLGDSTSVASGFGEGAMYETGCYRRNPDWLTDGRLRQLGFDLTVAPSDPDAPEYYSHQLARPALFVLELGGGWQARALESARADLAAREAAAAQGPDSGSVQREVRGLRRRVDWIERGMTRLFLIDAGGDLETLRAKYPDRSRYAIVRGTVRPRLQRLPETARDSVWVGGEIGRITGEDINVPAQYQERLTNGAFIVTLGFGKRLEPFIEYVR